MKYSQDDRSKVWAVFQNELRLIFNNYPDVVSMQLGVSVDDSGASYASLREINILDGDYEEEETHELIERLDAEISTLHSPAILEYYNGKTFTREDILDKPATRTGGWFAPLTTTRFRQ